MLRRADLADVIKKIALARADDGDSPARWCWLVKAAQFQAERLVWMPNGWPSPTNASDVFWLWHSLKYAHNFFTAMNQCGCVEESFWRRACA